MSWHLLLPHDYSEDVMVGFLKAWVAVWCLSTTPAVAWTTPTSDRRGLLARSFSGACGSAAVTLSTWTARPLPSRAATAAEAKAMLAERQGKIDAEARAAAAAAALKVSNFQTTELGLRYEELRAGSGPPPQVQNARRAPPLPRSTLHHLRHKLLSMTHRHSPLPTPLHSPARTVGALAVHSEHWGLPW